jgi:diguanylate cyclase (GGDEF)-like protein
MAIAACTKLSERGYRVPEDIIVTGFDGIDAERYFTPRLTTARLNLTEAARVIAELLVQLDDGQTVPMDYTVFHKITYSQSCGCQSKSVTNANSRVLSLYDHIERVTDFNQQMSRMFSTLTGLTFDEAIFKLRHYIDRLNLPTVSIYAAQNYLSTKTDEQSIGAMTASAITILNKRDGFYTDDREHFRTSTLAPDLEELLAEDQPLLILPIHFQDIVQGYMLLQPPNDFGDFTQLYMLHINLNQIMGLLHSQHSLRAALSDMEYMHSHDYMTNLYNRRGFYARIHPLVAQARRQNLFFAVYSIDMNGLKHINDTHGHQEGDFAINQIALALEASAPEHALCSRFGGDEFTVAMVVSDANRDPEEYCSNVKKHLERVNQSSGKPYTISASFGVSCCIPDADFSFDRLILQADENMYSEKEQNPYFRGRRPRT